MTRKNYRALAKAFHTELLIAGMTKRSECRQVLFRLADRIADELKADNSRFSKNTFLEACGFLLPAEKETN